MPGIRQATPLPFSPPIQHQTRSSQHSATWAGNGQQRRRLRRTIRPIRHPSDFKAGDNGKNHYQHRRRAETGRPGCALRQGKPGRVYSAWPSGQDPLLSEDHAREIRRKTAAKGDSIRRRLWHEPAEGNHARVRRPSRQLYNGPERDSRGSHFTAVTTGQSLRDSRPTASLPVPPDSNRCRCLVVATRHVATMWVLRKSALSFPATPPPPSLSDRPTMHCQY